MAQIEEEKKKPSKPKNTINLFKKKKQGGEKSLASKVAAKQK